MQRLLLLTTCLIGSTNGIGLGMGHWGQVHDGSKPSIANCTWKYYEQVLDHFGDGQGSYNERYCEYSKFWEQGGRKGPIYYYVGNESPVDEYVNNTGLMWELGEKKGALLIFAEHRYEGKSVPLMHGVKDCISYCTTSQALADYVTLITDIKKNYSIDAPVVAFGGSYGGMLAGWIRIKYPDVIAGAIAASAPVRGFPSSLGTKGLDSSSAAQSRGLGPKGGSSGMCFDNLRSSWPLIQEVGKSPIGRELLSKAAYRCKTDPAEDIIKWGQVPWFFMGEGDYPFPSTYITYSVSAGYFPLPAWPMRVACSKGLNKDWGVAITGNVSDVKYSLKMGAVEVNVDWEQESGNGASLTQEQIEQSGVLGLVRAMADAASVWHNLTKDKQCYGVKVDDEVLAKPDSEIWRTDGVAPKSDPCSCPKCEGCPSCPLCDRGVPLSCSYVDKPTVSNAFAWDPICCNEDLYLACTYVQGAGRDIYWPPNQPRGYTMETVIGPRGGRTMGCFPTYDAQGLFGTPKHKDAWSKWITDYYHTGQEANFTNIIWSNGALDPWSGGGVYPEGGSAMGPMVQNLTADGSSVSLIIDLGAHHLDLFFPTPNDPPSALSVRIIEEKMIDQWVEKYWADRK